MTMIFRIVITIIAFAVLALAALWATAALSNRTQWVFVRCNVASDGHTFMCAPFESGDNLSDCEAARRQYIRQGYMVTACRLEETEG